MVNLTQTQKIDLLKMMFSELGYEFYVSKAGIPSYRESSEEPFTPIRSDFEPLEVAKEFKFDFKTIPPEKDQFHAVGIMKDGDRFSNLITYESMKKGNPFASPGDMAKNIIEELRVSGAVIVNSDFEKSLLSCLKTTSVPSLLFKKIQNANQSVFWPENHIYTDGVNLSSEQIDDSSVIHKVVDSKILEDALFEAAKRFYTCPYLFAHETHAILSSQGIGLSFLKTPSSLFDMDLGVANYLLGVHKAYSISGREALELAAKDLNMEFKPLSLDKRKFSDGAQVLKQILRDYKDKFKQKKSLQSGFEPETSPRRHDAKGMLEVLSLKAKLWSIRGALNVVCSFESDVDKVSKMNTRWNELIKSENLNSKENVKAVLHRVESIYGNVISSTADDIVSKVESRINSLFSESESVPIQKVVSAVKTGADNEPLSKLKSAISLDVCLSDEFLNGCLEELKVSGDMPSLNVLREEIEDVSSQILKYGDEPNPEDMPKVPKIGR